LKASCESVRTDGGVTRAESVNTYLIEIPTQSRLATRVVFVPLHIIDEVVARDKDQSITLYVYSPEKAALSKL
jgi:hypothetical protein